MMELEVRVMRFEDGGRGPELREAKKNAALKDGKAREWIFSRAS